MTLQNNLIPIIAKAYRIERGTTEPVEQWRMRVIYSMLGQMAYASLWDVEENEQPVSVVHFKSRMKKLIESYCDIFNDLHKSFGYNYENLLEEIYTIQLNGGTLYHTSYRLAPTQYSCASAEQILFTRGMAPGEKRFVSGQGTYLLSQEKQSMNSPQRMFQLPEKTLIETWEHLMRTAKWSLFHQNESVEFLRLEPPFKYGYWQRQKEEDHEVSLIRMGINENRFYYLYKEKEGKSFVSQLPTWMSDGHRYRRVSNALLAAKDSLPVAIYHEDGPIVTLALRYLMPAEELDFIKLYSWPTSCIELPHDFNRIFAKDVFYAVKTALEPIGYQFVKE